MATNPRVTIKQGAIEGLAAVTEAGKPYFSFRGIPYAEPPIGDLRFKPPVPHAPWTGVKDATKDGNKCVQIDLLTKELGGSEDCLFLNVYTPQLPSNNATQTILPIIVHIHGGGFVCGSGGSEDFGPDFIVEQDTILVSMNYRLGPLGFLCLNIPEAPGNVGLRDQTLALKWVQENIQYFNGDLNNVTLIGISAGSASVEYQLLSPMSRGLFHKAVLQSGSVLNPWAVTKDPLALIEKVKKKLNVKITEPAEVLKYFKNIDANELMLICAQSVDQNSFEEGEICPFTPVIEKTFEGLQPFMNEEPLTLLKSGNFMKVPTITGICENEGCYFKTFYEEIVGKLDEQDLYKYLPSSFKVNSQNNDKVINEIYKPCKNDDDYVEDFLSDLLFVGGIHVSLKNRMQFTPEDQNFFYMFSYRGSLNISAAMLNGVSSTAKAMHGDDFSYLGKNRLNENIVPTPEDKLTAERMVKMWTDFAKFGNPTPKLSPIIKEKWLPITLTQNWNMFNVGKELQMTSMPWKERMDLWDNLYRNQ